jgi:hypothetical protein
MFQNNWFQIRSIGYFFAFRFEITIQWFAGRKKQKNRGLGRDDHKGRWSHMPYAQEGHLEVVKTLLDFGGRELAMIIREDGARCLLMRAHEGHLEVVKALLKCGGRELAMITRDNGARCLLMRAQEGHLEVVKALLEFRGRELEMLTRDDGTSGGGESAAGVWRARAADADYAQWSELPLHRTSL